MMKRMIFCIAVTLSLIISAAAHAEENPQFQETVTSLGSVPKEYQIIPDSVKYSTNFRQISYVALKGKTHNVIRLNDRTSPDYYAVRPGFPRFSATNRHAYIAYKSKNSKASVVVDWEPDPILGNADNFIFSFDGERYAYRVATEEKQCVVIDGKPNKWYTGIPLNDEDNILFSHDSKHLAYVAYKDEACKVVVDGEEEKHRFEMIEGLKFSPDSKSLAYKGRVEKQGMTEKWCVVRNGKRHQPYSRIFSLIFSPNSQHLAYIAIKDQQMVMVLNGQEQEPHDQYGLPTFAPNSKKLAFSFREDKNFHVVVNSDKGPAFERIYKFFFSLDSSRFAYIAGKKDTWQCTVDGKVGPVYEIVDSFKFSLDSNRYAYAAVPEKGKAKIVVDGKPHESHLSVGEPYFSPNSKHTVYRARREKDKKWVTILNGEKKGDYYPAIGKYFFPKDSNHIAYNALISLSKSIMIVDGKKQCADHSFNIMDDPYFSPDSKNLAYIAGHGQKGEFFLVVNGHVLPTKYGGFFKDTPIIFDDEKHFHVIGMREPGPEFLLIEVEIPEKMKLETELSDW